MSRQTGRYGLRFLILAAIFLSLLLASAMLGRYRLSPAELAALLGLSDAPVRSGASNVLFQIRLPRIAAAVLIGAALSSAGAAYQGMFRNPMVSPDILGASTAAGFGAALGILLGADYFGISLTAFVFGLAAVLLSYLVSRFARANETLSLILAGMVVSSLFSAGTSFVKLVADTQEQLPAITYWLMGSLSAVKQRDVPHMPLACHKATGDTRQMQHKTVQQTDSHLHRSPDGLLFLECLLQKKK